MIGSRIGFFFSGVVRAADGQLGFRLALQGISPLLYDVGQFVGNQMTATWRTGGKLARPEHHVRTHSISQGVDIRRRTRRGAVVMNTDLTEIMAKAAFEGSAYTWRKHSARGSKHLMHAGGR